MGTSLQGLAAKVTDAMLYVNAPANAQHKTFSKNNTSQKNSRLLDRREHK